VSVHVRKFRHRIRSAYVRICRKSCGSGSADWRVRSPHISGNITYSFWKMYYLLIERSAC